MPLIALANILFIFILWPATNYQKQMAMSSKNQKRV